jgi:hypothetical protein
MIHPICWQKAGGAWTVRLLLMKGTAWASRTLAKESKNCTGADGCVIHVLMRVAWKGYVKQLDSYGSYDFNTCRYVLQIAVIVQCVAQFSCISESLTLCRYFRKEIPFLQEQKRTQTKVLPIM